MRNLECEIWEPHIEVACGPEYLERIENVNGVISAEYSDFTGTVTVTVSRWSDKYKIAREIAALGEETDGNQGTD